MHLIHVFINLSDYIRVHVVLKFKYMRANKTCIFIFQKEKPISFKYIVNEFSYLRYRGHFARLRSTHLCDHASTKCKVLFDYLLFCCMIVQYLVLKKNDIISNFTPTFFITCYKS